MIPLILGIVNFCIHLFCTHTPLIEMLPSSTFAAILLLFLIPSLISFIGKCHKDVKYLEAIGSFTDKKFEPISDWQRLVIYLGKLPNKSKIIMCLIKKIKF